jgi:hypothetical protein
MLRGLSRFVPSRERWVWEKAGGVILSFADAAVEGLTEFAGSQK